MTILHEPLASPEEIVINFLNIHKEINNAKGRELTGIDSENEMKRVFQRLQKKDLIYLDPNKKASQSRWLLKEKSPKNNNPGSGIQVSLFD